MMMLIYTMCAGKRSFGWALAKQPAHLLTHNCADSSAIPISVFSALQYHFQLSVLCNTNFSFQCYAIPISVLSASSAIPILVFSAMQCQCLQTFYETLTSSVAIYASLHNEIDACSLSPFQIKL